MVESCTIGKKIKKGASWQKTTLERGHIRKGKGEKKKERNVQRYSGFGQTKALPLIRVQGKGNSYKPARWRRKRETSRGPALGFFDLTLYHSHETPVKIIAMAPTMNLFYFFCLKKKKKFYAPSSINQVQKKKKYMSNIIFFTRT